jgi:hypothetical protein
MVNVLHDDIGVPLERQPRAPAPVPRRPRPRDFSQHPRSPCEGLSNLSLPNGLHISAANHIPNSSNVQFRDSVTLRQISNV